MRTSSTAVALALALALAATAGPTRAETGTGEPNLPNTVSGPATAMSGLDACIALGTAATTASGKPSNTTGKAVVAGAGRTPCNPIAAHMIATNPPPTQPADARILAAVKASQEAIHECLTGHDDSPACRAFNIDSTPGIIVSRPAPTYGVVTGSLHATGSKMDGDCVAAHGTLGTCVEHEAEMQVLLIRGDDGKTTLHGVPNEFSEKHPAGTRVDMRDLP